MFKVGIRNADVCWCLLIRWIGIACWRNTWMAYKYRLFHTYYPKDFNLNDALSFYMSQNILGWSKFFVPDQKFISILGDSWTSVDPKNLCTLVDPNMGPLKYTSCFLPTLKKLVYFSGPMKRRFLSFRRAFFLFCRSTKVH